MATFYAYCLNQSLHIMGSVRDRFDDNKSPKSSMAIFFRLDHAVRTSTVTFWIAKRFGQLNKSQDKTELLQSPYK